ncbi:unnamed protein product [Adineta ricciae]|uniref:Prohormone-4 n=1 Tax=Adineta ricciae TaxID=249248 RepID=A0A814ZLQ6_ADIRI|nr:unnamed protein product [Adineta ricciae]
MTKSLPSIFLVFTSFLAVIFQVSSNDRLSHSSLERFRSWPGMSRHHRHDLLRKWPEHKRANSYSENRRSSLPFDLLSSTQQFKGCIDPSEPFQCPQSEHCIALQFICDGHPGDCPNNLDENEETCIAAKRPAKENIEKFLHAEYTLHGSKLFTFLFGEKLAKSIDENNAFWFDTLASAFSVAKTIRRFAEKTRMSSSDLAHFQSVLQLIHDGRLEEVPLYVQEAVNQGLASLVEKLYDSGFLDQ